MVILSLIFRTDLPLIILVFAIICVMNLRWKFLFCNLCLNRTRARAQHQHLTFMTIYANIINRFCLFGT